MKRRTASQRALQKRAKNYHTQLTSYLAPPTQHVEARPTRLLRLDVTPRKLSKLDELLIDLESCISIHGGTNRSEIMSRCQTVRYEVDRVLGFDDLDDEARMQRAKEAIDAVRRNRGGKR